MTNAPERAKQYRVDAQAYLDLAKRMSSKPNCARLAEMARRWIELAKQAEPKAPAGGITIRRP